MACNCATCRIGEEVPKCTAARVGEIVLATLFTATPEQLQEGLKEADRICRTADNDKAKSQAQFTLTVTRHLINLRERLGTLCKEQGLPLPPDMLTPKGEEPSWAPTPRELSDWLIGGSKGAEGKRNK